MRDPFRALPTLAVAIAALLFVAWISLAASGPQSLYAAAPAAAGG